MLIKNGMKNCNKIIRYRPEYLLFQFKNVNVKNSMTFLEDIVDRTKSRKGKYVAHVYYKQKIKPF